LAFAATLTTIAEGIGWPRAQVSGTAAFYSFFHTRPRGKYCVLWSDNITDRMLGNADLMDAMCKKLWLEPGRVSEDGLVSVNTTSCTGMCDQGPAVLVNYRAVTAHDPGPPGRNGRPDPRAETRSPNGRPNGSRSRTTSAARTSCSAMN
jgi:NADH:ubiquinone oxidoreductase subunit E